jgi:HlyD family secretion protein
MNMRISFLKHGKHEQEPAPSGAVATAEKKKKRRPKRLIAVILIIAVVVGGLWYFRRDGNTAQTDQTLQYQTAQVERRTVTQSLSGNGTLEAANSYSVTSLVEGEILTADFEEGDIVEEGTVLYELDSSDASNSIENSEISLNAQQRNYERALESKADLTVTSPIAGTVVSLEVKVGDEVQAGQTVATIRDSSSMELKVNFPSDDAAGFYVGQSGTVTLDGSFETLNATVTNIAGSDTVLTGNRIVRQVTLTVENPGGLSNTQLATATINGIGSSDSGTFTYKEERTVTADASGEVASLAVSEGDQVQAGSTLVQLTSDTIDDTIQSQADAVRQAELSLENAKEALENYTITSPISGTIVEKAYKAGEKTEQGKELCTIYDLSYLTLTLNVDELDISKVQVGQEVIVTADAVEGQTYQGVVTKVSVAGTTQNGYTTYPVTIQIDETDGLMPGMNVNATIVMAGSEDTLAIPQDALERGDKVLVTLDSPSAINALDEESPEGYVYVAVTTGVSDDSYIEVTSGLQEGDTVAYIPSTADMDQMGMGGMVVMAGPAGGPGGH